MTPNLNPELIKEIAGKWECGMICYWNMHTGKLLCMPDIEPYDDHYSLYKKDFQKIKKHAKDYIEFERPSSRESFIIMECFVELLLDQNPLKNNLMLALNHKKPFQGFKQIIEDSGEYREQWFQYRNAQYIQRAKQILETEIADENSEGDDAIS